MNKLKFNPDNAKYYSDEFIKGFECGTERQFNSDMKERKGNMTKSERNARKHERVNTYCAILEAIPVWYHQRKFKMHCDGYANNGNIAIHLFEVGEGPYCSLTVNITELPAEQFALDSNNFPEAEVFCIANRIAHPTDQILTSGYCRYPVYELEPEIIKCCNKILLN